MSTKYHFVDYETNQFTIGIDASHRYGFFEDNELGEDNAGGLWFNENMKLIDYDGVFELPSEVIRKLTELNYYDQKVLEDY